MSPPAPAGLTPQHFLHALWKQKACWILLWLLATAAVLAAVWSMPRRFQSQAILTVEPARPPGRGVSTATDAELRAQLQVARLKVLRRDHLLEVLRKVWPDLVAQWKAAEAPRQVEQLRGRITIATIPESRGRLCAVRITFQSRDATRGATLVNRIAADLAKEFELLSQSPAAGPPREQNNAAWARVAECRQALAAFEDEHGGDLEVREKAILGRLASLQAEIAVVERAQERVQSERRRLEQTLEDARQAALARPASGSVKNQPKNESAAVRQLRERIALLRARYKDPHPDVRRAREELVRALMLEASAPVESEENDGEPVPPQPADLRVERLQSELASAEQRSRQLEQDRERLSAELTAQQERLAELTPLRRSHEALRHECEVAERAYRAASLKQEPRDAAPPVRLVLLEEAVPDTRPGRPDRRMLALVGALLALLPCAAIAVGREIGAHAVLVALGLAPPAADGPAVTGVDNAVHRLNGRQAAHAG